MAPLDTMETARYIHDTGRLIHNRIFRIQSAHMRTDPEGKIIGELSMQQLHTLTVIWHRGQVSITELASVMSVSPPSASAMVDRLVEKGLLTREPHPKDRRKVEVRVTEIFEVEAEKIEAMIMQVFVDLVKKIGPDMAAQWCEVLSKINTHLIEDDQKKTTTM
ncbi:MAG: MarR family transcriptional regulator [Desulfobacterales bacterium]|nr:MarR family transcriptional regulator [Desulfobacterales bacterium]